MIEFNIDSKGLLAALAKILPASDIVKAEVQDDILTLSGSSSVSAVRTAVPIGRTLDVQDGEFSFSGSTLKNLLPTVSGELLVSAEVETMKVAWASGSMKMGLVEAEEPYLPPKSPDGAPTARVDATSLVDAISKVSDYVDRNRDARAPVCKGVLLQLTPEKGSLSVVATDLQSLSAVTLPVTLPERSLPGEAVLPPESVRPMLSALRLKEEKKGKNDEEKEERSISVRLSEDAVSFSDGTTTVISPVIVGKYPDWRTLFGKEPDCHVSVPKKDLSTVLGVLGAIGIGSGSDRMTISSSEGGLVLACVHTDTQGKGSDYLPCKVEGTFPDGIALPSGRLSKIVQHVPGDTVHLLLRTKKSPLVVHGENAPAFTALTMPKAPVA